LPTTITHLTTPSGTQLTVVYPVVSSITRRWSVVASRPGLNHDVRMRTRGAVANWQLPFSWLLEAPIVGDGNAPAFWASISYPTWLWAGTPPRAPEPVSAKGRCDAVQEEAAAPAFLERAARRRSSPPALLTVHPLVGCASSSPSRSLSLPVRLLGNVDWLESITQWGASPPGSHLIRADESDSDCEFRIVNWVLEFVQPEGFRTHCSFQGSCSSQGIVRIQTCLPTGAIETTAPLLKVQLRRTPVHHQCESMCDEIKGFFQAGLLQPIQQDPEFHKLELDRWNRGHLKHQTTNNETNQQQTLTGGVHCSPDGPHGLDSESRTHQIVQRRRGRSCC